LTRKSAIDIGCGEGILTRQLAKEFDQVLGIDLDDTSLAEARELTTYGNVSYERADFLEHARTKKTYDLVTSVVVLHHMDAIEGIEAMKKITNPGGIISIVGVARPDYFHDFVQLGFSFIVNNIAALLGKKYNHSAPIVWPPPLTNKKTKKLTEKILPGSKFRKQLLNRYTVIWEKPI